MGWIRLGLMECLGEYGGLFMKLEQVVETYDDLYAAEYDQIFFLDEKWAVNSFAFQLDLLRKEMEKAGNWLDVACGTGFVLSKFPHVERAGLDISPSMLRVAGKRNPGVELRHGNYLDSFPEWEDRWDIVSCMWWAYNLVETMSQIKALVQNLARWTSPRGICFVPLHNMNKIDSTAIKIPYVDPKVPGRVMITGITWTWIQENGKRHDDVISPQVEHLVGMFEDHFASVEVVEGPIDLIGEGWRVQDVLIARDKK